MEKKQKSLDSNKQFIKNKSDSELNDLMVEFDNYESEESTFTSIEKELIKEAKKVWEESHPNPIEMALFGAKWRQERMYSEEEVLKFTQTILMQYKFGNTNIEQLDLLKETLQQLKKKII